MSAPVANMTDFSITITTRPIHDDRNHVSSGPAAVTPQHDAINATNHVGPTQQALIHNANHPNVSRAQRLHELNNLGSTARKTRLQLAKKLRRLRLLKRVRGYTRLMPPEYIPAAFIRVVNERSGDIMVAIPNNWPSVYLKKMNRVLELASGGTDSFWPVMKRAVEDRLQEEGVGSPEEVLSKDLDVVIELLRKRSRTQHAA